MDRRQKLPSITFRYVRGGRVVGVLSVKGGVVV